ncbi:efflux RND transporter periplasmic adaptor subunit [Paracraurococcus lichenis]|uniref:Efflux RND transporter periplasmic adaptor subunit n=1 Tax=Paracraurococcus lichenis TaxID=3064888 RepID=A0ABT9DTC3_9PROT|nr:efflux RND transporter periplasmic adaptor subunit [Paracraurococcus sp. LOR1-02]MDO9707142.1 efflux RND transporter periplasmic adaptor subunit [Paracraurococcus sp. LOR1-02]
MNMIHQPPPASETDASRPAVHTITLPPAPPTPTPAVVPPVGAPPVGAPSEPPQDAHAADPAPSRRRLWIPAVLLLVAAGGGYAWHVSQEARPVPTSPPATVTEPLSQGEFRLSDNEMRALRIEEMQLRDFRAERVAEGRIAYNEDRATPVYSPYNGRVVRAPARMGDTVKAGDTLLEIETTDLAGAANDLLSAADAANKARATLDQARREEARQASLFSARAASQRDVEQARVAAMTATADLRSAEATLAASRDKLRVLGRSAGEIARIEQTRMVNAIVPVLAPIGGTVTQRKVGPGQWLSTGAADPVFTIADLSTMWLVAAVRELDAPLIKVGQQVKVTVGALPDREFDARVTTVGAGLDPVTRRMTVRAEVQDPDRLLKPEMFATFRIAVGEEQRAVAVPVNALIFRGPEASVWVALDANRFMLRKVKTGIRSGDVVEVTEGLKAGERVVTGGALFIDRAARID